MIFKYSKYLTDAKKHTEIQETRTRTACYFFFFFLRGILREQAVLEMKTKTEELTHSVEELNIKLRKSSRKQSKKMNRRIIEEKN